MSIEILLNATCSSCGLNVHAGCEDHGVGPQTWVWCSACERLSGFEVDRKGNVSSRERPWKSWDCRKCGRRMAEWNLQACPRCAQPVELKWGFAYN